MRERFIKVDGNVYYESELNMMSDNQLKSLINECKKGIDEIDRKSEDYRVNNYDENDIAHYQEVLAKFESASVYLQADIVMLDKIIKSRRSSSPRTDYDITVVEKANSEDAWCRMFVKLAKTMIFKRKWRKIAEETTKTVGYSCNL